MSRRKPSSINRKPAVPFVPTKLRIVSGSMKGRRIEYNGDPGTRPMKERTREAVFSLLGGKFDEAFVIDLFAGTGVLAFESISRGATNAIVLEMARPAIRSLLANIEYLGIGDLVNVHNVDTLRWLKSIDDHMASWPAIPWITYCCPPYKLWCSDHERIHAGLKAIYHASPPGSHIICEADKSFDIASQLTEIEWDVRNYPPAYIGVSYKPLG